MNHSHSDSTTSNITRMFIVLGLVGSLSTSGCVGLAPLDARAEDDRADVEEAPAVDAQLAPAADTGHTPAVDEAQEDASPSLPESRDDGAAQAAQHTELLAGVTRRGGKEVLWATWLNAQRGADMRCGRREVGPCVVYDCSGSTRRGAFDRVLGADLGAVRISGDGGELALTPDAEGRYAPVATVLPAGETAWVPDGEVRFDIAGRPAWSRVAALQFPSLPVVLAPSFDEGDAVMSLHRDASLQVSWEPAADEVAVMIRQTAGSESPTLDDLTVLCAFPGPTGRGVVPDEALHSLVPSALDASLHTTLQMGHRRRKIERLGETTATISLLDTREVRMRVLDRDP